MSKNIVQLNNQYIQDENQRRRYLEEERRKKNRFMGWVLILVMLLFILPTYNLVQSYQTLLEKRLIEIGRASCREECRSRWSPYH